MIDLPVGLVGAGVAGVLGAGVFLMVRVGPWLALGHHRNRIATDPGGRPWRFRIPLTPHRFRRVHQAAVGRLGWWGEVLALVALIGVVVIVMATTSAVVPLSVALAVVLAIRAARSGWCCEVIAPDGTRQDVAAGRSSEAKRLQEALVAELGRRDTSDARR